MIKVGPWRAANLYIISSTRTQAFARLTKWQLHWLRLDSMSNALVDTVTQFFILSASIDSEVTQTTSTSSSVRKPSFEATFFMWFLCNCISLEIQHPPHLIGDTASSLTGICWLFLIFLNIEKDSWHMLTPLNTVCIVSIDGFYKLRWLILLHSVTMSWNTCRSVVCMWFMRAESLCASKPWPWYMQLYLIHIWLYDILMYIMNLLLYTWYLQICVPHNSMSV